MVDNPKPSFIVTNDLHAMTDDGSSEYPSEGEELIEGGDRVITTTGEHGIDISSQRMDRLDREALQYALTLYEESPTALHEEPPSAIDLGCGLGVQGLRFSLLGMETTLIDIHDISDRIELLSNLYDLGSLRFLQKDVRNLQPEELPEDITLLHSQRFIHYLEFEEAQDLISLFATQMKDSGRLYISASGLQTELGDGYPDRDVPLEDRHSELAPGMAKKHDIHDPVCLYTIEDMDRLLTDAGFQVRDIQASNFGNIKAVAERPSR